MIDTMGYSIHEMHLGQARRYFPMPDYDLSESQAVKLTIHGAVVDVAYSRMLIQKSSLPLSDILALDRMQKKLPIEDATAHKLRASGLIEGRKPKYHVSAAVAQLTANKADYIRMRSQDDVFYAKLLTDYLEKFGQATRQEVNQLLIPKFSEALDDQQKTNKINNLLTKLRRKGLIVNQGADSSPRWHLAEKNAEKKERLQRKYEGAIETEIGAIPSCSERWQRIVTTQTTCQKRADQYNSFQLKHKWMHSQAAVSLVFNPQHRAWKNSGIRDGYGLAKRVPNCLSTPQAFMARISFGPSAASAPCTVSASPPP